MKRARNLRDQDIAKVVEILDGWTGKLTWDLLIEAVEKRLFSRYTRQALHKHARIADAFALRKESLARAGGAGRKTVASPELQLAIDQIDRLKAKCERLEAENNRLLEQFVRWAYNAHTRGLDEAFLNRPLPPVNRQQTRLTRNRTPASSSSK